MTKTKLNTKRTAVLIATLLLSQLLSSTALAAPEMPDVLVPMGCTVGIDMKTDGVMVVSLTSAQGDDQSLSPAGQAGVLPGDIIIKLGNADISTAEDFMNAANNLTSEEISITVNRSGKIMQMTVLPQSSDDGYYKLGMLLRDGVSGIGTVTYYDPNTSKYGALGHPISDIESGALLPLESGSIMESTVADVKKGVSGEPGELSGIFSAENILGSIEQNTDAGIFGRMNDELPGVEAIPVARQDQIELGEATIYSNVEGTKISEYTVEITRLYRQDEDGRNMMITVTDQDLLSRTGGIVQGMSGSPVIQNGMLIGAVTHVLINDPTRGYGISIENMIRASEENTALSMAS